jgi:hypothetical protein
MRYRLALGFAVALAACGGGDSDDIPTVPTLPWGSFRHDATNSGVGSGIINNEASGNVQPLISAAVLGGVTTSTPAIDNDGNIFLGTETGIVSFDSRGTMRWRVTECVSDASTVPCTSNAQCGPDMVGVCNANTGTCSTTAIGRVTTSPTVTAGGAVVFGVEAIPSSQGDLPGAVFALREESGNRVSCMWAYRPPEASPRFAIRASAVAQVYALDLSLLTVVIGGSDGRVLAINGDGTPRWSFGSGTGDVTSTSAFSVSGTSYVATPDGVVAAIDFSGRPMWQTNIGRPMPARLLPSPAVGTTVWAIGGSSVLFGINPDGTLKWQYAPPIPFSGSPAFLGQSFTDDADTVFDTIVYTVDVEGNVTGVRDSTGEVFQPQRCSQQLTLSCSMDSCQPGQGTCDTDTNRCSLAPTVVCTGDSCQPNNCVADTNRCSISEADCSVTPCEANTCTALTGMVPVTEGPVTIETSPAVSGDLFVLVGTASLPGRVCARGLDNRVPGDLDDPNNPWLSGCITLGAGLPTRSSPVIGGSGSIHVTTDEGLFVLR